MKLHDLHPAPGSRRERTRVGRGIAAGKGKTAGRGTKGQRSRTGSSIPAWFEGGQTPIHMRVPKLHGFNNRFRVEYAVVNIGRIETALAGGRLEPGPKGAPATVNAELLYAAGLLGRVNLPLKILGSGELTHPLLAIADAFSAEARRKIEAAGGTAMTLEVPEAAPAKTPRSRAASRAGDSAALGASRPAASSPEAVEPASAEASEPAGVAEGAETAATAEVVETKPARRTRKASATAAAEPEPDLPEPSPKPAGRSRKPTTATSEPEATSLEPSPKPARRSRKAAAGPAPAESPAPESTATSESPEAPA
jgi:large subunit ribosomal protein L15